MVRPLGRTACSVLVDTTTVRLPRVAAGAAVSWTVRLRESMTVIVPTVMPGPAWTVVVPWTKVVLAPVSWIVMIWLRGTVAGVAERSVGVPVGRSWLKPPRIRKIAIWPRVTGSLGQ